MTHPAPPAELPGRLWRWVEDLVADGAGDPEAIGEALVSWADGRSPADLEALLDALRGLGAYPISLHVLEAAWSAEVPPDLLGRVAQDWVGTVLHGLGDRVGALEVAAHLSPRALELGPAFAGDLGDALLGWGLTEPAAALIRFAASALPGDMALRFDLGVVQKLSGEWPACRASFEAVLRHHDDRAARWNLGVACTALRDWPAARAAWAGLGFGLPPGEADFAAPGELTAVQLPAGEIVWGVRLCPARVELRTLPCLDDWAGFGDVLLVDGVSAGQVTYPEGEPGPVLPALEVFDAAGATTLVAVGPPDQAARAAIGQAVDALNAAGWPAADWTDLAGDPRLRIAMAVLPPREMADARATMSAALEPLPIGPPAVWEPSP